MSKIERRYYEVVPANTEMTNDYIVPTGDFYISKIGGNAGSSPSTNVCIEFDPGGASEVILLSTHGDADQEVKIEIVGDGIKVLRICLTNDQGTDDPLGGFWTGST